TSAISLPAGTQLGAGSVMPGTIDITAMTWTTGATLGVFTTAVTVSTAWVIPFEGIIPGGSTLFMSTPESTRPTPGTIDAIAPMLPAGDLSWSIRLVSGADLGAADT